MGFKIDLDVDYTRDDDAPRAPKWFGFTGPVMSTITKIETGESGSGNKTVDIFLKSTEEDCAGVEFRTLKIPVTGINTNKKPNVLRFVRYIDSVHTFKIEDEDKAKAATQKFLSGSKDIDDIIKGLIGKPVAVDAGLHSFPGDDGAPVFMVKSLRPLLKTEYEAAVARPNRGRRALPAAAEKWYASRTGGNKSGGGAAAETSSSGGSDDSVLGMFDDV